MIIKKEDFDKKVNNNHLFAADAGEGKVYLCTRITYIIKHCLKYNLDEFQILKASGAEECRAFMEDIESEMTFDEEENIDRLNDLYQLCENSLYLYHEYDELLEHLSYLEYFDEETGEWNV